MCMFDENYPDYPLETKRKIEIANAFLRLLKRSSERYELGIMTKEEAAALVEFAFTPVRYGLVDVSWQNTDIQASNPPRIWTFDEYHRALADLRRSKS